MNAPATIRVARPIRVDETPAEAAYRAAISIHCANCDEQDMAVRVWLAMTRDQASIGVMRAESSMAGTILAEATSMAAQAVYAPASTSTLMRLKSALWLAMEAARAIERCQRDG